MRATSRFTVELDSGTIITVVADQRDYAQLEAQPFDLTAHYSRARFMAWTAARRAGQYRGTWEAWNTKDAVEVAATPAGDEDGEGEDAEGEDEQRLDPGSTAASGAG